jgi:hypothetical protein
MANISRIRMPILSGRQTKSCPKLRRTNMSRKVKDFLIYNVLHFAVIFLKSPILQKALDTYLKFIYFSVYYPFGQKFCLNLRIEKLMSIA